MLDRYRDVGKGEVFLCTLWWYTTGSTFICVHASLVFICFTCSGYEKYDHVVLHDIFASNFV